MRKSIRIIVPMTALVTFLACQQSTADDAIPSLSIDVDRILVTQHPAWEYNTFRYRLPEFVVSTQTNDMVLKTNPVERQRDGSFVITGGVYEKDRLFAGYRTVVSAEPHGVTMEATITNHSSTPWNPGTYSTLCFENAAAPSFADFTGDRTSIMVGETLMSIDQTAHGRAWDGSSPLHHAHLLTEDDGPWLREYVFKYFANTEIVSGALIVRSAKDGQRHVGVAWNDSRHVSYNLDKRLNCIHSEPRVGALGPGESRTLHGKVYFVDGPIDEVMQRFKTDFPSLGYGSTAAAR